jgi:hypothetical protein
VGQAAVENESPLAGAADRGHGLCRAANPLLLSGRGARIKWYDDLAEGKEADIATGVLNRIAQPERNASTTRQVSGLKSGGPGQLSPRQIGKAHLLCSAGPLQVVIVWSLVRVGLNPVSDHRRPSSTLAYRFTT